MKFNPAVLVLSLTLVGTASFAVTAGETISRDQWVGEMGDLLPALFCQDGTYFRSCFETDADQCHEKASTATTSCLRQHRGDIPSQLRQPQDGQRWGEKVGTCAGTLYEAAFSELRVDSESCNNPMGWQ